jgi:prevent-host-death family protein
MTTITATNARKELYKLLSQIQESHEPICITGKNGSGILISEEDFAAIQETLHLQSIPGMTQSIIEGMQTPTDECSEDVNW